MENEENCARPELTVGISYPSAIIIQGIADLLEKHNFKVIFRTADMSGTYDACSGITPDIILVSTGSDGFSLDDVSYLAGRTTVVVMVSKNMPEISVEEALKAGASGIISTDEAVDNFIQGINAAVKGNFSVSRELVKALTRRDSGKTPHPFATPLTSREAEVLELIGKGLTNRQIGEELFISTYTVKAHMRNITAKLNLKNRQQASAYASKRGLLREFISGEPGEPGEPAEPME